MVVKACCEVDYVPAEAGHPYREPLRYLAIRIRKKQQALFADGSLVKYFALVSNIWDWTAKRLLEWHRERAGSIEAVHDVVKNELAGGVMPCGRFGANAAWLRLTVLTHNVLTALQRLALPPELLRARPERLRFSDLQTRPVNWCITRVALCCAWGGVGSAFPIGRVHFACCLCLLADP